VAQVDSKTQESQRGATVYPGLGYQGPTSSTDDAYTQEHPKTRGYNRV
jgi:hypothetical protein